MDVFNILKKSLGFFLIFLVILLFTACKGSVDKTWVVKGDGVNLPEGVYRYYLRESYKKAEEILQSDSLNLEDGSESPKPLHERKISGVSFNDWVRDDALESCKDLLGVERLFDENSLTLTEKEKKEIDDTTDEIWKTLSATFEKASIGKDDVKRAYLEYEIKYNKLFDFYFEENGTKKVTNDDLLNYYKSEYINYSAFTKYAFVSSKEEETQENSGSAAQLEDARNQVKEYVKLINSGEKAFSEVVNIFKSRENLQSEVVQTETIDPNNTDVSEEILDKLKKLEVGKADFIEFSDSFIVVFKNDVNTNLPDLNNKEARKGILKNMKANDFKEILDESKKKIRIETNTDYIKTFVPSDIFKDD